MSYSDDYGYEYGVRDMFAADAALDERVAFIRRTYAHVGAATLLFVALVATFINTPAIAEPLMQFFFAMPYLIVIALMVAGFVAHRMAASHASPGIQYMGLGFYALAEALFFTPLLYLLHTRLPGGDDIIAQSGIITLIIFGGLTGFVMLTRKDFSFMRNFLVVAMFAVLALMVASWFGGFHLGLWFVVGMIVLMCGFILYETSNVLHHYHTSQHVAASLAIFSSLTTLFWYVLQLMSILGDD